ncbi:MAG: hypothetical protein IJ170_09460, partial [Ruminococcus sp.]|nr:hypothetical protein [Ruminococcus sp.]
MNMIKCPEGHHYNGEKFEQCPICAREKRQTQSGRKAVKVRAVKARPVKAAPAPEKKPEVKAAPA